MNLALRTASILSLAAAALAANAAIIDFNNLPNDGMGSTRQGNPVVYGGFSFASGDSGGFAALAPGAGNYTGSVALFADAGDTAPITMTQVGGGAFTLNSMQLANLTPGHLSDPITFTGVKVGGGTVTNTFTFTAGAALQTDTFTGFTNLASVRWQQYANGGYGHQFDNITVNGAANPTPEPSALAALGLGAVAVLRRRRK